MTPDYDIKPLIISYLNKNFHIKSNELLNSLSNIRLTPMELTSEIIDIFDTNNDLAMVIVTEWLYLNDMTDIYSNWNPIIIFKPSYEFNNPRYRLPGVYTIDSDVSFTVSGCTNNIIYTTPRYSGYTNAADFVRPAGLHTEGQLSSAFTIYVDPYENPHDISNGRIYPRSLTITDAMAKSHAKQAKLINNRKEFEDEFGLNDD